MTPGTTQYLRMQEVARDRQRPLVRPSIPLLWKKTRAFADKYDVHAPYAAVAAGKCTVKDWCDWLGQDEPAQK
jgi:hypothetical protein